MAEYGKLSPEDQKLHYMCLKQVLMQTLAGAGAADGSAPPPAGPADASAAPPPAAAPAPAPDASAPAPALKAEIGMKEDPKANGENPLHKAEIDAAVQAAILPLVKAVKHVLEHAPQVDHVDRGYFGSPGRHGGREQDVARTGSREAQ